LFCTIGFSLLFSLGTHVEGFKELKYNMESLFYV
jgi:hypothetical protein